jgi:hypothetical protein
LTGEIVSARAGLGASEDTYLGLTMGVQCPGIPSRQQSNRRISIDALLRLRQGF